MLKENVKKLKGVGEKLASDLALMNIYTIEDLLEYFPYRYNFMEIKSLHELIHDDQVTIVGKVIYPPTVTHYGRKKSRLMFQVDIEQTAVKAVMFNRAFAKNHLLAGKMVTLTGKWDAHRLQITVAKYKMGEPEQATQIESMYSLKGNVKNFRLTKLIQQAIEHYSPQIEEILPQEYLINYKIPSRRQAIKTLHIPESRQALHHARRRFIYEELLIFQLKMAYLKMKQKQESSGQAQTFNQSKINEFITKLPYILTGDQQDSLTQILNEMNSTNQMNRLLQGDVGSGKTAVATIGLYASFTAGFQGALMVPTEILAEQHYDTLCDMLPDEVSISLLTSSIKGKVRENIINDIANGETDIVIGTHSLIQSDVQFLNLGLIVIDEQHRFGVEQRGKLREKGLSPDVLFMTATPIPRTLAITAFGDMDVSTIKQLPAGRKIIQTYWVKENLLSRVLSFVQKNIERGEQAYFVSPLIEESDVLDYQNAIDLYHELRAYYPEHIEIELLHGRLPQQEKEILMKRFARNDIKILVATTVIEVGVNVPNATSMIIYDAERFGLAQLHQLRGRVGRGSKESYCILIADPKGDIGKERMKIMTETNDGFHLAEADLKLRGPGDFFGKKQSGLPEFKVADLVHDYRALETAREDAQTIIENGLLSKDPQYELLKNYLQKEIRTGQQFN